MGQADWQWEADDEEDEEPEQIPLFASPKARRVHDFLGIFPEKVMPSRVHMLERNGRVLFIRSMRHGAAIPAAQHRIWSLMVKLGEMDEAPGAITVICVWGEGIAQRETVVYDHMGVSVRKVMRPEEFKLWLRMWWEGTL